MLTNGPPAVKITHPAPQYAPTRSERAQSISAAFLSRSFALGPLQLTPRILVFLAALAICVSPWGSPPLALALGLLVALAIGNPFPAQSKRYTSKLLQWSVVGLGFGMNAQQALQAGCEGLLFSVASIVGTLTLGYFVGRWLGIDRKTSHLISSGTAICGGSAIAAVGPVLRAEEGQMSVALGTVFILNSVALFLFPAIGHGLHLSQNQFGLWAAIAIHDTSSVVGAASHYGSEALQIATTIKLARALWIIPVALGTAFLFKTPGAKIKLPYFILGFIGAMLLNTYVPALKPLAPYVVQLSKIGLTLTLFLIGAGLSAPVLRSVGVRPFVQGVLLWIIISSASLWVILRTVV
ncbi:YeiH family protein [Hymenobacter sediminicola]|uniref:Putative sulfate exporter family transporter n=1 Tax=Hymenobacter sediminicola TaxID=2761579 RepID=A0A7G7W9C2_9BACT|nr:putative sulfate exporter family transporter [Hymenobacter sediminicola]QNH62965.1 putative sulfate exporter family transporter [Hymenobacter sediminicola]